MIEDTNYKYLNTFKENTPLIKNSFKRKLKNRIKALFKLKKVPYMFLVKCFPHKYKNSMTDYLLKNNLDNHNLVGVEIGVGKGFNALSMLKHLPISTIYLVDPYEPFCEGDKILTEWCATIYEAEKTFSQYKDEVVFIQKFASDAVNDVPDDLDFLWFDATGDYKITKDFLNNWYSKVKPGGIFGGKRFNSNYFGLCKAVLEFTEENNLELHGALSGDWWVAK